MGIKGCMLTFTLTSILCCLMYLSTKLARPISDFQYPVTKPVKFIKATNSKDYPVSFAYLISASNGDAEKLKRLLLALYHPGNYYLIHIDYGAPRSEHLEIAMFVSNHQVFQQVGNIWIVGKPNLVTYRGPTMLATTLHAMANLLKICQWDWFINLSASDYPLVTQDGMAQLGLFFQGLLPSTVCLDGKISRGHCFYTTQTSSHHLKGISKHSYATPKPTGTPQLTMISTISPGTILQSNTQGHLVSRTTGEWSRATGPLLGSSSRTTELLTRLTKNSSRESGRNLPMVDGVTQVNISIPDAPIFKLRIMAF